MVIRGLGFQHATKYHMEARRTWLATRILGGRWKPTRTSRYLVPSPSFIHLRLTSVPQCQVRSFLLAHMAADLCQLTFTPEAALKVESTF